MANKEFEAKHGLNAPAITLGGTALGSLYSPIAGSSSLTTLGTIATGVWQGTDVAVAHGGTGASTAGAALTALGASPLAGSSSLTTLGTIGTGVWGATDVAVAHGGTGASDASTARSNLGITDTTPGGSPTHVQYNNSGAFGGSANLTFDGTTLAVSADQYIANGKGLVVGNATAVGGSHGYEIQALGTGGLDAGVTMATGRHLPLAPL